MPIYEYMCVECNHSFEEVVMDADEPKFCPECKADIKRVVSVHSCQVNYSDSREYKQKVIDKDRDEIVEQIKSGDENALADIAGESAVNAGAIKKFIKE